MENITIQQIKERKTKALQDYHAILNWWKIMKHNHPHNDNTNIGDRFLEYFETMSIDRPTNDEDIQFIAYLKTNYAQIKVIAYKNNDLTIDNNIILYQDDNTNIILDAHTNIVTLKDI